jgi:Zn-dependent peptidase ImmA (M78 family)
MSPEININGNMISWAINRAGFDMQEFIAKHAGVQDWIDGTKKPTVKQLETFSKRVYLPFGYLFLPEPPQEKLPIPFFRTLNGHGNATVSINVYDTILLLQQRQNWLSDYLRDNDFRPLNFVGKYRKSNNVTQIVADIRNTLNLTEEWASNYGTWEEALSSLIYRIETIGVIMVFNGVVENNTHRPIPVEDCRGFVLVDELAPFMFINNSDGKAAQMFTIVHELAHIWTGQSAGFDFRRLQPANEPIEILCDKIAAEFLVPENSFKAVWTQRPDTKYVARYFKVSEIVVARRALDLGVINKPQFFKFYNEYSNREFSKKENQSSGGDFYATTRKRLSMTFAGHINNAVKSGQLLYRDAYKLTGLKGDTFQTFFTKHF